MGEYLNNAMFEKEKISNTMNWNNMNIAKEINRNKEKIATNNNKREKQILECISKIDLIILTTIQNGKTTAEIRNVPSDLKYDIACYYKNKFNFKCYHGADSGDMDIKLV